MTINDFAKNFDSDYSNLILCKFLLTILVLLIIFKLFKEIFRRGNWND